MNKNAYKNFIEQTLFSLKNGLPSKVKGAIPFSIHGEPYELCVVTKRDLSNDRVIRRLAHWRRSANRSYHYQTQVTFQGTKKWAKEFLLEKKDRILFWVKKKGTSTPFGHMGFYRFNYDEKWCEIDNVIRGRNAKGTKGVMTRAQEAICTWAFDEFQLKELRLKVITSNKSAIALYERVGFAIIEKVPMRKEFREGLVHWVEDPDLDPKAAERFFLTMRLFRKKRRKSL